MQSAVSELSPLESREVNPPLITILGPTGVGKTALSLDLAEHFDGEVVSADSRQIYRRMNIGTGKASAAEQARIPHHLLSICDPDSGIPLSTFQSLAYETIDEIGARGKIPFLVGGSALYLRAVLEGLRIPEVPPNPALRDELERFAKCEGASALHDRLARLDPPAAAQIDYRNVRRVVRALEIVLESGERKSDLEGSNPPPYRILTIGLTMPRERLYERTDRRVEMMVEQGLVEEVRALLESGYNPSLPALTSLGYREIAQYLAGEFSLDEAIERIQIETHRFVRHQYSWFRRMKNVRWYDAERLKPLLVQRLVGRFLDHSLPADR